MGTLKQDALRFYAQLKSLVVKNSDEDRKLCWVVITDVKDRSVKSIDLSVNSTGSKKSELLLNKQPTLV